ncbi:MAG: cytochrome c biogenesis protein CcdA, partial [PVC group bacterium]
FTAHPAPAEDRLVIHFFGSRTCAECLEIKETLLRPLAEEYPGVIDLRLHEIEEEDGFRLMLEMEKRYGVGDPSPQELFLPQDYLVGAADIMARGEALIREYLEDPGRWQPLDAVPGGEGEDPVWTRFHELTFAGILAAGLVDGVNPCAIATMIFLISFLTMQNRRRSQVIAIGLTFTAAVYVTYLLIGIGAFRFIVMLRAYRLVSQVIRWSAVALAGLVGLLSFRDALVYRKSGDTGRILIQMPKPVKLRIHKLISGHLKGRRLILGAVVTGFLVTLFEAVCTGQVYLPAIIVMSRTAGTRTAGWLYLLFYNLLFVLPLLAVMILTGFGLTWHTLAHATQKNLPRLKMLMGIVLIGLALLLALA